MGRMAFRSGLRGALCSGVCGVGVALAVLLMVFVFSGGALAQSAPKGFLADEGNPPPGANNPKCEPTKKHPYPVVLVHGTFETMDQNWAVLSPRLKKQGYCVYALNYNNRGMGPIGESAQELDRFVNGVLGITGAKRVQLVGHSQGGMMPRYWIKYLGGAEKVEDLVGIAPSNYGTNLNDAFGDPSGMCQACAQQNADSRFIRRLNRGDDTPGRGSFTQIATRNDEIIVPYTNCFLRGTERTRNITIQNFNNGLPVTHQNIYNDTFVQRLVFDALANPGPANPQRAF